MRNPLIRLVLGGALLFAGYSLYGDMVRCQDRAAGAALERHEIGPEKRDDDFFNRPFVSEMPETPDMKANLRQAEMLRFGVLGCFGAGGVFVALGVKAAQAVRKDRARAGA